MFAWYALLHELGHLVGLAHVEDPGQLMHPQGRIAAYGAGDLRGLAAAGSGPCSRRG
ncbi:MAG: M10 family metallopeptidase domain-containing protein [Actinomycetota bacterium]|nr:M10 family metallopeptidase domain-containing protein [Actinomycetota bacterium]